MKKTIIKNFAFLALFICNGLMNANAQNPNIWIHTDLTAIKRNSTGGFLYELQTATESEVATDVDSDPDDQVAMAMYLMQANKFNTKGIVLGVTNRLTAIDSKKFFDEVYIKAYETDVANVSGYPTATSLKNVTYESSLTIGAGFIAFDKEKSYKDFNTLEPTVQKLVRELEKSDYSFNNPLYVLVWGPLHEAAMAAKHFMENVNNSDATISQNAINALKRLYIVAHWTTSFTGQGTTNASGDKFDTANCNSGGEACDYLHDMASVTNPRFRYAELGASGQKGIVDGSGTWFVGGLNGSRANEMKKSKLGNLAMITKFVGGKPDGSDCATFYTVLGKYGVNLSSFPSNGTLTKEIEVSANDKYKANAPKIWDDLLIFAKDAVDGGGGTVTPPSTCATVRKEAETFNTQTSTGVQIQSNHIAYINNGDKADYSVNVPCQGSFKFRARVASAASGGTITLKKGTTTLGSVNVTGTGGWTTWQNKEAVVNLTSGTQTFRLEFSGTGTGSLFNVDWFEFEKVSSTARVQSEASTTKNIIEYNAENLAPLVVFPNPSLGGFTLKLDNIKADEALNVYSNDGNFLYNLNKSNSAGDVLNFGKELKPGIYILNATGKAGIKSMKLLKE